MKKRILALTLVLALGIGFMPGIVASGEDVAVETTPVEIAPVVADPDYNAMTAEELYGYFSENGLAEDAIAAILQQLNEENLSAYNEYLAALENEGDPAPGEGEPADGEPAEEPGEGEPADGEPTEEPGEQPGEGAPVDGAPAPLDDTVAYWRDTLLTALATDDPDAMDAAVETMYEELAEEQVSLVFDALSDEENAAIGTLLASGEVFEEPVYEIVTPSENYTSAASFLAPVVGKANTRMRSMAAGAALVAPEASGTEGLELNKSVTANGDGTYTISLETWTTGAVTSNTTPVPTDIVLVLDQSGSMDDPFSTTTEETFVQLTGGSYNENDELWDERTNLYVQLSNGDYSRVNMSRTGSGTSRVYTYTYRDSNGTIVTATSNRNSGTPPAWSFYRQDTVTTSISKLQALKDAVTAFSAAVAEKAETDNIDHRIAVVGFASGGYYGTGNSEVFVGSSQYAYGPAAQGRYTSAFQNMNTLAGQSNITATINALDADGRTYTNYGIEMANGILNANPVPAGQQRNRIVIVFTDGEPGASGSFDQTIANLAIYEANATKNTHSATVYSVGIFDGANATLDQSTAGNTNNFMHYISGNYPNALSMANPGTGTRPTADDPSSYYLSAGDADALDNIFEQINENIESPTIDLGSSTVVKDVITQYFDITGGITIKTAAYNGDDTWAAPIAAPAGVTADVDDDTVDVTGFDFTDNFVSDNPKDDGSYGAKLIVEITVTPKDGFWGGNNVPTNDASSGVYVSSSEPSPLEPYPVPEANVPLDVPSLTNSDKDIYCGNTAPTAEELVAWIGADVETWKKEYVDIQYEADAAISNTADGTYTVTATVTPKYDGADAAGTEATNFVDTATAQVNVYTPSVTYKDSEVLKGTQVSDYDYATNNFVSVEWKHGATAANTAIMGDAPALTYAYAPNTGSFEADTPVTVTVMNGAVDITGYTSFIWSDAGECDCTSGPAAAQFTIHVYVPNFDLTITKTISDGATPTQSFIFDVTNDSGFMLSVVLNPADFEKNGDGTASITIYGLPSGDYTVTERGNWSWQYVLTGTNGTSSTNGIAVNASDNTADFENTRRAIYWLGDSDCALNIFNKKQESGEPV